MMYEEELKKIASENKHSFIKRNETTIELVRMMGDQIDSRFKITETDGDLECNYTFWVEGEGTKHCDDFYTDDRLFLESIKETIKKSNKYFDKECIDRDEDPSEW